MEEIFGLLASNELLTEARLWFEGNVLVAGNAVQIAVTVALAALAWLTSRRIQPTVQRLSTRSGGLRAINHIWKLLALVCFPVLWLLLQWSGVGIARQMAWPNHLMVIVATLLSAWVVIRMVTSLAGHPAWSGTIAFIAWTVAALNILGLLDTTIEILDRFGVTFGDVNFSALTLIKGMAALAVLLWIAGLCSRVFEERIKASPNLTPSVQVLIAKLFKVTLIIVAFLAAISAVGIKLTAFAVFGGAIGVGIGFGLQKIVSNLISGVILLLDKSIKPGDVIAVADYFGRVDSLGARYVSVTTLDGVEHLIPNEDLIVNRVENWSHTQNLLRLKIPVGVHYESDVPLAIKLCAEAAAEVPRVLEHPNPKCLLRSFGDSSVDLEIRFWINDPMNGRANVRSEILLNVWHKFHAHGIEIPYPQRDIHIRTPRVETLADLGGSTPDPT